MLCRLLLNKRYPCLSKEEASAIANIYGCDIREEGDVFLLECSNCAPLKRAAIAKPETGREGPTELSQRSTVTMDWLTSRLLANLALARPLAKVLEPFVGTGAIAIEAEKRGAYVVGVDVDLNMLRMAARNTSSDLIQADSRMPPFRRAFDAAVGDAPYGRMSQIEGDVEEFIRAVVEELLAVAARVVIAIPAYFDLPYFRSCAMYVHGGLYRVIVMSQSGGGPS